MWDSFPHVTPPWRPHTRTHIHVCIPQPPHVRGSCSEGRRDHLHPVGRGKGKGKGKEEDMGAGEPTIPFFADPADTKEDA